MNKLTTAYRYQHKEELISVFSEEYHLLISYSDEQFRDWDNTLVRNTPWVRRKRLFR